MLFLIQKDIKSSARIYIMTPWLNLYIIVKTQNEIKHFHKERTKDTSENIIANSL